MSQTDREYCARRAEQERCRAASSEDPAVRNVHLELAARYAERVIGISGPTLSMVPDAVIRTT